MRVNARSANLTYEGNLRSKIKIKFDKADIICNLQFPTRCIVGVRFNMSVVEHFE